MIEKIIKKMSAVNESFSVKKIDWNGIERKSAFLQLQSKTTQCKCVYVCNRSFPFSYYDVWEGFAYV